MTTAIPDQSPRPGGGPPPGPPWGTLAVLLVGQGMAALDTSIVNVAAPSIRRSLRSSPPVLQLAISVYLLVYGALLVTGSRLGRDHGTVRIFRRGLAVFTVASLLCGAAPTSAVLVGARALQGAGAALMVPQVLSFVGLRFTGAPRSRAVALYSFVLGAGVAVGQVLGGVLVTSDLWGLGWRAVFLVNVPVGVVLGWWAATRVPVDAPAERARFDVPGLLLLVPALLALLVPLAFGPQDGWRAWTLLLLAAGVVMAVAFVRVERRSEERGGAPLIPPSLLRTAAVSQGLSVVFLVFAGYGALLFTVAVYLQGSLGYSPFRSGLVFAWYAVGFGTVNMLWARLPGSWHRSVPVVGLALLGIADGSLAMAVAAGGWGAVEDGLLLLAGMGHGAGFGATVAQVVRRAPEGMAAAVSGLVTTSTQVAIAVGVAALGSVYLATGPGAGHDGRGLTSVCWCLTVMSVVSLVVAVRMRSTELSTAA